MRAQDDVVSKPFRIPELVPKIEQLLERYSRPGSAQQSNSPGLSRESSDERVQL